MTEVVEIETEQGFLPEKRQEGHEKLSYHTVADIMSKLTLLLWSTDGLSASTQSISRDLRHLKSPGVDGECPGLCGRQLSLGAWEPYVSLVLNRPKQQ